MPISSAIIFLKGCSYGLLCCMLAAPLQAADLPDPDIFDGSVQSSQSSSAPPTETKGEEKEENNQSSASDSGSTSEDPQAESTEQGASGSGLTNQQQTSDLDESGQGSGARSQENKPEQQPEPSGGGAGTQDSGRKSTVDLSIFQGGAKTKSEKPRVFSEAPRTSGEKPIEVPDDFEESTSIRGVLNEIEEQREAEREKVIQQIENDPNRGSEEGSELPTDL